MFDKVLLATDLSEEADGLLPCFYSLCPDDDTEVAVAHIFKDKEDAEPGSSSFKKVQSRVRAVVAELRRAGYENAREIYRSGEVFEQLTEIADDEDAGLIMVASHGKGFFKSALLGSTTFDLARATDRPLFVSKPVEDAGDELLALVNEMGGMELFIQCAGIGFQNRELKAETELETVGTNAEGFVRMMDAAFRYFTEKGGGRPVRTEARHRGRHRSVPEPAGTLPQEYGDRQI